MESSFKQRQQLFGDAHRQGKLYAWVAFGKSLHDCGNQAVDRSVDEANREVTALPALRPPGEFIAVSAVAVCLSACTSSGGNTRTPASSPPRPLSRQRLAGRPIQSALNRCSRQ
jgi:hypothetical protein